MIEREIDIGKGLETIKLLWMLKLRIPRTFRGMHRTLASRESGAPRGSVSLEFLGFDRTKRIVTGWVKLARSLAAKSQLEKEVEGPNNLFAVERLWPVCVKAGPHERNLCVIGFK